MFLIAGAVESKLGVRPERAELLTVQDRSALMLRGLLAGIAMPETELKADGQLAMLGC